MYLDKCMYSKEDPNCFIKYRVNIDNFNDYWYYDFSSVFKNYEFVLIEELQIPMCKSRFNIGRDLLKLFCDIMTSQNKVVVLSLRKLHEALYNINSQLYFEACSNILDDLLINVGFEVTMDDTVLFYTGSKLGTKILYEIEELYDNL